MLSSSTLSDSSTSPIFYVDNIASYLIDDATNYYTTSYYHSPSPLIYNNEIDNFGNFITNHELSIIQQSMLAQNNNNSINIPDDSSILELDTKVDSSKSGDHEGEIINGIVEDNGEMNHIITSSTTTATTTTTTTTASHPHVAKVKKRRSSNKDRHSKIRTAHGLRDRRMRLSLQVARPFFQLQDMLGYDKSSATVEWLLIQSKPAIDELLQSKLGSPPSGVTTTKCTTTSSNSDDGEVESTKIEEREGDSPKEKRILSSPKVEPNNKQKRKRTTKEERKVARERAKKRTLERMQRRGHSKEEGNIITNPFLTSTNYQQGFDISQNVPSYRIPTQQNMMGGPL